MIDTVSLLLESPKFTIKEPKKFNPSAEGVIKKPYYPKSYKGFYKCINNPTKDQIINHEYMPKLTLLVGQKSKDIQRVRLKIEFSGPKIIYGNNFEELNNDDFESLIKALKKKLKLMGVHVTEENLRFANVSTIHYSKNFVLDKHSRCFQIINELEKIDLSKRLDLSHTDYKNEGHAVHYHTNSYQIVFYDKLKDMEKTNISEKRAIEDDSQLQYELYKRFNRKAEILRMEVRLNKKSTIKRIFEKINIETDTNFQNLFDSELSKKVLTYYFDLIWENWFVETDTRLKPVDLFLDIESKFNCGYSKILKLLGAMYIIDSVGMLGLRSLMNKNYDRSWYRLKKEIEQIDINSISSKNIFQCIMKQLNNYKPLRFSDYDSKLS